MSGKGDTPRPFSVDADTYASNWDAIFRGVGEQSKPMGSNPIRERELSAVGANPTSAATYVDNDSG